MKYVLGFLVMMILSCNSEKIDEKEIVSVNELKHVDFTESNNVLLDVRTPEEFAEGHIPNAINIDVTNDNFEQEIQKLDKEKTYYVYCQAGSRSSKATSKLLQNGFTGIVNLKDGYSSYKK